jgi:hypothetical protein
VPETSSHAIAVSIPVGGVIPWFKTITGVPALPANFLECDGSTISDSSSPLNGQDLPDLNGDNSFVRGGSTSWASGAATGGSDTHTHTAHSLSTGVTDIFAAGSAYYINNAQNLTHANGSNLPVYYQVVWIMRIK